MTCKDCTHFIDKHNTDNPELCKCTFAKATVWINPNCGPCKLFEGKDGTYHDGTEHCPKCGKAVSEWGLCDECRKMYEDMRCINDEERKAWDLLIAKKNHALFQSMLCRQEDNSWESVSK